MWYNNNIYNTPALAPVDSMCLQDTCFLFEVSPKLLLVIVIKMVAATLCGFCLYSYLQVLLLDADNLPLKDPASLFSSPHMTSSGAMMWNDLWSTVYSSTTFIGRDTVYPLVGINKQPYWVSGGILMYPSCGPSCVYSTL